MDTEPTPTGADAPRTYAADNWQGLSDDFLSELIAHAESQGTGGHLLVGRGRYIRLLKEIERLRAENAELERLRTENAQQAELLVGVLRSLPQ